MSWKIRQLGEVCRVIPGFAFKSEHLGSEGIPVIKIGNIPDSKRVEPDFSQCFPISLFEDKHKKFILKSGDILLAMTGATAGKAGRVLCGDDNFYLLNQRVAKLEATDIAPSFLWNVVSSDRYRSLFYSLGGGAAQPNMSGTQIESVEIPCPPSQIQRRIGNILSAYDDLIENNRRRIQLLEESARQLYKEWFVRLRFPGHEHVKVMDGVPEGWERNTIKDVSSIVSRGITPSYDEAAKYLVLNQKCVRNHFVDFEFARRQKKEVLQSKLLQHGDVLINSTGTGTLGRVAQYFGDMKNCTVDSHITLARHSDTAFITYYGYVILNSEDYLSRMGRGSTNQTELSKAVIEDIPFLKPTLTLLNHFEIFARDIKKQIQILASQNNKLAQSRDLLLPKLMSGEVAV